MPHVVTIQFPRGDFPGPDHQHGTVTSSDHPRIPDGAPVEYHRDHAGGGEDVLRVRGHEEYRISLADGYETEAGRGGSGMKCTVLDDEPWRVTHQK